MNQVKQITALLLAMVVLFAPALAQEGATLAVVNGVSIPAADAQWDYQSQAALYEDSEAVEEELSALREQIASQYADEELMRQQAAAMGLDQFTEAETAELTAEAENQYESMVSYYMDYFARDEMSVEEVRSATVDYFDGEGYTLEGVLADLALGEVRERLYQAVTGSFQLSEQELTDYYNARVEAEKAEYEAEPYSFEFALFGESAVTYVPAGYRAVRSLLIRFTQEQVTEMYSLTARRDEARAALAQDSGDKEAKAALEQAEQEIAAIAETVLPSIREIQNKLSTGSLFDRMMANYNEDARMEVRPFSQQGYYLRADSMLWPQEYIEAAMALSEVGQVSEPVVTCNGVYLIEYLGEVAEGPVPLNSIRDRLLEEATDTRKAELFEATLASWREGAQIELYPDSLK